MKAERSRKGKVSLTVLGTGRTGLPEVNLETMFGPAADATQSVWPLLVA